MRNRVDLRNVLVAAAGADRVIDAFGVAVADRPNRVICEAVSEGGKNALEVGSSFKEIRIQEVGIEGVLLDMLPVGSEFPGMFA